jgi:putative spermidine/putrescine transport system permease protein
VTISIFLSGPDIMPMPIRIYTYIEFAVDPMIAAVSVLLILFSYLLIALLERLVGIDKAFAPAPA